MSTEKYADAPKPLRDFLFYMLTIRGRSPRTVDAYYTDLRTFLRYIKAHKANGAAMSGRDDEINGTDISDIGLDLLREVNLSIVYDFLNYTLTQRDNNAKTRARKVSSLRSFFKYLTVKEHALEENPVKNLELPSVKKALPKHLTLEESLELMAAVDSKYPRRDYCILTLLLGCGMRLSELTGINLQDIRDNTLRLLGKGNKERVVYMNDACIYALGQYLPERADIFGAASSKALFLSSRGTRITPRRVEQIVEQCLKTAGLDGRGYSPHKLRHTAATLLYQHGQVDIRVLKEILGHANLATTEIYTHVSDSQIEEAVAKSPLASVKMRQDKRKSQKTGSETEE